MGGNLVKAIHHGVAIKYGSILIDGGPLAVGFFGGGRATKATESLLPDGPSVAQRQVLQPGLDETLRSWSLEIVGWFFSRKARAEMGTMRQSPS